MDCIWEEAEHIISLTKDNNTVSLLQNYKTYKINIFNTKF